MEMLLTPNEWLNPAGDSPFPAGSSRLDWQGLAARLAAAAACRDALNGVELRAVGTLGSFDPVSARRLAGFGRFCGSAEATDRRDDPISSRGVNRTDSAECKPVPVIAVDSAGTEKSGDRGLK